MKGTYLNFGERLGDAHEEQCRLFAALEVAGRRHAAHEPVLGTENLISIITNPIWKKKLGKESDRFRPCFVEAYFPYNMEAITSSAWSPFIWLVQYDVIQAQKLQTPIKSVFITQRPPCWLLESWTFPYNMEAIISSAWSPFMIGSIWRHSGTKTSNTNQICFYHTKASMLTAWVVNLAEFINNVVGCCRGSNQTFNLFATRHGSVWSTSRKLINVYEACCC